MSDKTGLRKIRGIVFDVYGTLAEIGEKRRPYGQLLDLLREAGRDPQPDDAARLMSCDICLAEVPRMLGAELAEDALDRLQKEMEEELRSIRLYPEVVSTLVALRNKGYKMALCSNLATPYAEPIKRLLPFELDAYAWSFEVGAVKPEAKIYEAACQALACLPEEVIMIGDTLEADYDGPRRVGMHAFFLDRKNKNAIANSLKTLDEIAGILA